MDTSVSKQLLFLAAQNAGFPLEKIIEQILESSVYNFNEVYIQENVQAVKIFYINLCQIYFYFS